MSNREATMTFCFEKTSDGAAVVLDTFSFVFHGERKATPALCLKPRPQTARISLVRAPLR